MSRVIVARHSPENGCLCDDGALLIVRGRIPDRIRRGHDHVRHRFVSAADGATPSRYGWVADRPELSGDAVLASLTNMTALTESDIALTRAALEQVAELPEGTPVACGFVKRGILQKAISLHVHRVVFHAAKGRSSQD